MFDKHLTSFHSILWNTGFQRLMDSSALEVYAQTNNNAHTGDEYMLKKQRTDASEVTNLWLMGISCSKDMFVWVWELHTFLRTLVKLPVWWIKCNIQTLREVAGGSPQNFGTFFTLLPRGMTGKENAIKCPTHFEKWDIHLSHYSKMFMSKILSRPFE